MVVVMYMCACGRASVGGDSEGGGDGCMHACVHKGRHGGERERWQWLHVCMCGLSCSSVCAGGQAWVVVLMVVRDLQGYTHGYQRADPDPDPL